MVMKSTAKRHSWRSALLVVGFSGLAETKCQIGLPARSPWLSGVSIIESLVHLRRWCIDVGYTPQSLSILPYYPH